jgi:hypothetical protein
MTWLAGLWARLAGGLAAVGAVLAAALALYGRGRADARRTAELKARRAEQRRQERADEAADHYRRDGGAARRLRDGQF